MKKLITIMISVTFILTMTSCEDFLEEKPKNQISVNQYFNSPDDVKSVVNSLYGLAAMNRYISGDWQIEMNLGGFMSGMFENERTERPGPYEATHLTLDSKNMDGFMYDWWREGYDAISRANTAIKYIPGVETLSEADANKLLAEARFFRAFNYFFLVKDFGDVPLITDPYESLENIYVSRTPSSQVYDLIIEDLEWALNNGGLPDVLLTDNGMRITKGVVAATLADVQLQKAGYPLEGGADSYKEAAKAARIVINSNVYSLIPNGNTADESAFNKMRISENEPEYIFSVEAHEQFRWTWLHILSVPKYAAIPGIISGDVYIGYRPLNEYLRVYNPEVDLRGQNNQIWHNSVERDGVTYDFNGNWAPYTWYDETALYQTNKGGKDVSITLYSEVLLIAAEAIAQSEGVTSEAVGYLADVRSRAYWQTEKSAIVAELAGLSKDQFIKEVWKERLRELPLTYKIWPDIQRTRLYPVTSEANPGEVNFVNVVGHTNPYGATYQEKHLLYPISTRVRERNPELTGNGY